MHLWFADLAKKNATLYLGSGSDKLEALGPRDLTVTSSFDKGEWRVVFKRRMRSAGALSFEEAGFAPVAFSVWDGAEPRARQQARPHHLVVDLLRARREAVPGRADGGVGARRPRPRARVRRLGAEPQAR